MRVTGSNPAAAGRDDAPQIRDRRAARRLYDTPALIVSAHQNETDFDAPTDLEIAGYVTKPTDFDLLLGEIDALTRVA